MTVPEIIYEDTHIIVVTKPVGMLSQADESEDDNMCSFIAEHTASPSPYVGVIHRLDRGVGGVMVYAKTKTAAGKLSAAVSDKNLFKKQYLAVVHGQPCEPRGELHDLLFKDSHLGKSFVTDRVRKGVKEASLSYEVTAYDEKENLSLVRVTLHTGRTHQIRVQFSSRMMPLVGDKKYGARDNFKNIGLWSLSLAFSHPVTEKPLEFSVLPSCDTAPWVFFENEFHKAKAL